jgi:hypothetical protein
MLNLLIKALGCGKLLTLVDCLDGEKVYISGTVTMLTGLATIIGALISFLPQLQTGQGIAGAWAVLSGPSAPIAKSAIIGGWLTILSGFKAIGVAHAAQKAQAAPKP